MFYEATGSRINSNDIPQKLCDACLKKLKTVHKFKQACVKADEFLEAHRQSQTECLVVTIKPKMEIDNIDSFERFSEEETTPNSQIKSEKVELNYDLNYDRTKSVITVGVRKIKSKEAKAKKIKKEKPPQARVICEQCGKDILKSRLSDHIGAKHNGKRFECDLCKSSYVEKANLIRHMFYKHLKNQRLYPCNMCDKIYEQSGSRSLHIKKIHTNDLRHVCGVCNKRFVKPSKLKYHMATHSGNKRHSYY